jgi:hypothetical protein
MANWKENTCVGAGVDSQNKIGIVLAVLGDSLKNEGGVNDPYSRKDIGISTMSPDLHITDRGDHEIFFNFQNSVSQTLQWQGRDMNRNLPFGQIFVVRTVSRRTWYFPLLHCDAL